MDLWKLDDELLAAAYRYQFTTGENRDIPGLDWRKWAETSIHEDDEVARAQKDLGDRKLIQYGRNLGIVIPPLGVKYIETNGLADAAFIQRQFEVRRKILRVLFEIDQREGAHSEGLQLSELITEVGEPEGDVLPNYSLLRDVKAVSSNTEGNTSIQIRVIGRDALMARHQAWPLSAIL